eukprot:359938-Chlamydomonas_euryale.AAC.3
MSGLHRPHQPCSDGNGPNRSKALGLFERVCYTHPSSSPPFDTQARKPDEADNPFIGAPSPCLLSLTPSRSDCRAVGGTEKNRERKGDGARAMGREIQGTRRTCNTTEFRCGPAHTPARHTPARQRGMRPTRHHAWAAYVTGQYICTPARSPLPPSPKVPSS